jgi:hypothetical protein
MVDRFQQLPSVITSGVKIIVHEDIMHLCVDMTGEPVCLAQEQLVHCRRIQGIPIGSNLDLLAREVRTWKLPSLKGLACQQASWHYTCITGLFNDRWVKDVQLRMLVFRAGFINTTQQVSFQLIGSNDRPPQVNWVNFLSNLDWEHQGTLVSEAGHVRDI